jgi:hypothetical protein
MSGLIDSFFVIFHKSLNWKLWLYVFVISLVALMAIIVPSFVIILIGVVAFLGLGFSFVGFIIYFFLALLFIILILFLNSAVQGTLLNFSRNFLESGKLDVWLAWGKTKPRIFTSVKVEIIIGIIYLVLFVLCFLPFIFALINFLYSVSPTELALKFVLMNSPADFFSFFGEVISALLLSLLLCFIVFLVLLPFSVIYRQIPFYESLGTFGSIKRALYLAKKNYFRNFGFFLIFFLFIIVLTLVYLFLIFAFTFPLSLTKSIGAIIILVGLRIIVEFLYSFWLTVLSLLFDAKIYLLDVENERSASIQAFEPKPLAETSKPLVPVIIPVTKPAEKKQSAKIVSVMPLIQKKPESKPIQKPAVEKTSILKKTYLKKSFNTKFPEGFIPKKETKPYPKKRKK